MMRLSSWTSVLALGLTPVLSPNALFWLVAMFLDYDATGWDVGKEASPPGFAVLLCRRKMVPAADGTGCVSGELLLKEGKTRTSS